MNTIPPSVSLPRRRRDRALALLAIGLALAPLTGHAQFKVVGPDGKVTYTDRPPAPGSGKASTISTPAPAAASSDANLPFELRQTASRYPVTLYTMTGCDACEVGRQYLRERGIPYREKVVGNRDAEALQQITGSRAVPALTIGSQVLQGYAPDSWASYLDAAGYPRESRLPGSYSAPPPSPLVAARPAPAATPAPRTEPAPAPAPPAGGIRF